MKRGIAFLLVLLLCMGTVLTGCGGKTPDLPVLNGSFTPKVYDYTFSDAAEPALKLSREAVEQLLALTDTPTDYPYAPYYHLDRIYERLDFSAYVESHRWDARNPSGQLEATRLQALVAANNESFLANKPFGYENVEPDYLSLLCGFLVEATMQMQNRYPDLDWDRICCNLGNLKILYNVGMLDYAQVNSDMVLAISKNNTQIILNMKGEDGFARVLTHELMHVFQLGCACEQIPGCERRAGICIFWEDISFNSGDWTWLVEGSAERNMCLLTGGNAVTYQYKMDYICSMTLATLLNPQVEADRMHMICFQDDPQQLFSAFRCSQEEVVQMMTTMQVLQMQPKDFFSEYQQATGEDLKRTPEALNDFCFRLKPAVCITLAKEFYRNLAYALQAGELTARDLLFLIGMLEATLDQHLNYTKEEKAAINAPFLTTYPSLRRELFRLLEAENEGLDLTALYAGYTLLAGEKQLNASLKSLPEEKRAFLRERIQWLQDLRGLDRKIPME